MPQDLTDKTCKPCEGGVPPLDQTQIEQLLKAVPNWTLSKDNKAISRRFEFKGFYKTMSFVNAIAWIANKEGHHPDVKFGYNYCDITYTTHAMGGLSENDFICASKINKL